MKANVGSNIHVQCDIPNDSDDDEFSFTRCIFSISDVCMIYFCAHVNVNIIVEENT